MTELRLQVNVDHVATLRQARGHAYPDPVRAALLCEQAGAHGITVHLREDRRHIQDADVRILRAKVKTKLNLEIAAEPSVLAVAEEVVPDLVTLVPERREERTTEGGLDVVQQEQRLRELCASLKERGIPVSLFVDPEGEQVRAAARTGASMVELHTGDYANADRPESQAIELQRLAIAAQVASECLAPLRISAGHGLTSTNVGALVRALPRLEELNIGHAIVADAVFLGIEASVRGFLESMKQARSGAF